MQRRRSGVGITGLPAFAFARGALRTARSQCLQGRRPPATKPATWGSQPRRAVTRARATLRPSGISRHEPTSAQPPERAVHPHLDHTPSAPTAALHRTRVARRCSSAGWTPPIGGDVTTTPVPGANAQLPFGQALRDRESGGPIIDRHSWRSRRAPSPRGLVRSHTRIRLAGNTRQARTPSMGRASTPTVRGEGACRSRHLCGPASAPSLSLS